MLDLLYRTLDLVTLLQGFTRHEEDLVRPNSLNEATPTQIRQRLWHTILRNNPTVSWLLTSSLGWVFPAQPTDFRSQISTGQAGAEGILGLKCL